MGSSLWAFGESSTALHSRMAHLVFQVLLAMLTVSVQKVKTQGQRCESPSDCTDEWNPYCSKWGYCTWTPKFGNEGPPQSNGAVEDGKRGQCRTDSDCTPWAPSCGPLGYCRGGVQDGSFGAPTNPKKGGEPSDWIKKNAKSGAGRNEEYYGKIEDDNRRNHEEFRDTYPGLFPEEIFGENLVRLRSIEKENYKHCTYCKYEPKNPNDRAGGRNRSNKRNNKNKSVSQQNRKTNSQKRKPDQKSNQSGNSNSICPGDLNSCMDSCPSSMRVYKSCVASCGKRCA